MRFQSGWTKGKLNCAVCDARIGGFDYVGGNSEFPVYVIKSKVDFQKKIRLDIVKVPESPVKSKSAEEDEAGNS